MGMVELDLAAQVAYITGRKIMELYGKSSTARKKSDTSTITMADTVADGLIRRELQRAYPAHALLTEETEESPEDIKKRLKSTHLWIVDPLDGSDDFDKRTGDFAVMITYVFEGQPKAGAVYLPAKDKLYTAESGNGAFLRQGSTTTRIRVSTQSLEHSILSISRKAYTDETAEQVCKKIGTKTFKREGSRGVRICTVAEGGADFSFINDTSAGEWDTCAPGLVLIEAGGRITDYEGQPINYNKEKPVLPLGAVVSNNVVHPEALRLLREYVPLKH